jgi:succinate dehydrogenase / fumarate reductase membrane anchor subunit
MAEVQKLHLAAMRTPLARARGLGASHSGVGGWWAQRLTAAALVPLSVWFVVSVIALLGSPRVVVAHWVGYPIDTVLLLALIALMFHHMQLGLQVVIEDYVHVESAKLITLLAMKAVTILLALACAISVLKLAFVA